MSNNKNTNGNGSQQSGNKIRDGFGAQIPKTRDFERINTGATATIKKGQDFQARVKWAPGTVVVWDNRVTAHSALLDWDDGARRHLARITPQAEAPYETGLEERKAAGFEY